MKIEKTKHDHKLTHILKVGIFAMLMIAPLFASCSQLMYVTFNKNAYQSYTEKTYITEQPVYYETNEINTADDLLIGNIYHYKNNFEVTTTDYYNYFTLEITENLVNQFNLPNTTTGIIFMLDNGRPFLRVIHSTTSYINVITEPFDFVIKGYSTNFTNISSIISYFEKSQLNLVKEYIPVEQNGTLDNAFYFGVETMTESPLFNWTQNTALYTGIKAMTDNLQVQTNVIAVLVTYWTILTIIYIIIDIVLALFTKMTHLLVRSD